MTQPNVLLVLADQLSAHALGCAGSEQVRTPHLDALAAGGTRFDRAYVTFPLCVPSRASMMTGQMPHSLGIFSNTLAHAPAQLRGPESLAARMSAQGYRCSYAGKWHAVEASADADDGFEVLKDFGDDGLVEAVQAHLSEVQGDVRPFFVVTSFDDPHTICELARRQPSFYGPMENHPVEDLPNLPPSFGHQPYEPEAIRAEQQAGEFMYGTGSFTPDDWRVYRRQYADLIERTDANIGRLLDTLDELGLSENTVVIFSSDHGDGDSSHQWNQKTALFEEIVRIPLIVRWPGQVSSDTVNSSLISVGLDLLPTLCDVAGAPTDAQPGHSFLPAARGQGDVDRDYVVVETGFGAGPRPRTSGRTLIGPTFKYVVYSWGKNREQLFNLSNDPHEMVNLAIEARHADLLQTCRRDLLDWCLASEDETFYKRLVLPDDVTLDERRVLYAVPY